MPNWVMISFALALCAGAACKGKSTPPPAAVDSGSVERAVDATPSTPPDSNQVDTVGSEPEEVEPSYEQLAVAPRLNLTDAGEGKKHEYVYEPNVGAVQSVVVAMRVATEMRINHKRISLDKLPNIGLSLIVEVSEVDPAGTIYLNFAVTKGEALDATGVLPAILRGMNRAMESLEGHSGKLVVQKNGAIESMALNLAPDADPVTQEVLEGLGVFLRQMIVVLPTEPIGWGAKWTVSEAFKQNGVALRQTSHYELVKRREGRISVDALVKQKASEQKVIPRTEAQRQMGLELKDLAGDGEAEFHLRLHKVVPQKGELTLASKSRMKMAEGRRTVETKSELRYDVRTD